MTHRFLARALALAAACLPLALAPTAQAKDMVPGFQLVHDAPAGTSLITPDLPTAGQTWRDMIDHAKREVDLEQFYVSGKPGEALDPVIAALERAGKRGVKIRFLMEKKGLSDSNPETIARLKAIPNLEFRLIAWADLNGSGIIHAKFITVDGKVGYVGSQNFDWRSLSQIDETGLRITDRPIVSEIQAIFDHDWAAQQDIAHGKPVPPLRSDDPAPISANAFLVASPNRFDPQGVGDSQKSLVELIGAAKRIIRIEVMDYSTTAFGGGDYHVIDDALRAAAARGVKVHLLVADWDLTQARLPGLVSLSKVPNVSIEVARIPQLPSGFIPYARVVHSKTMTIDEDIAWIGTSNWEGGYLDTSRNLEVVLRGPVMNAKLKALQTTMWTSSYALPLDQAMRLPPANPGGD